MDLEEKKREIKEWLESIPDDSFTTIVEKGDEGVEIYTVHDQSGSVAQGFAPFENIEKLIKELQNILTTRTTD